ncbi:MAG: glycosyltransferase family 2 protein [Chloroflexota bacterium]
MQVSPKVSTASGSQPNLEEPPPGYQSDLDIIIVNYNTSTLLRDCLHSVFACQCNFRWRVFVVDNGSQDNSVAMVKAEFEANHPNLTLMVSPINRGFAFANNLALRQICPSFAPLKSEESASSTEVSKQSRYVLLLNPDTVVAPDSFQKIYDFMEAQPEAGVVGAKLVKGNGQLDLACRRSFPTPAISFWRLTGLSKIFPKNPLFARYNLTFLDPDTLIEVDSVCGAFMWVRVKVIQQVGILDETFFMYGEDLDWAFRIKKQGWKIFYNPTTTVIHYKGESSKQRSTGAILNFYQAMYIFYKKHYAPDNFFLLNWLIIFGIFAKGLLALGRNFLRPKEQRRVS